MSLIRKHVAVLQAWACLALVLFAFEVLVKQNCLHLACYAAVFYYSVQGYYSMCDCFMTCYAILHKVS